jgi:hypothetical protein
VTNPVWRRTRPAALLGMLPLVFPAACSSDGRSPPPEPLDASVQTAQVCVDSDGDGYGVGCARGLDCDDQDPTVGVECFCDEQQPGCPCDSPDAMARCGRVTAVVAGQTFCGEGVSTCANGVWGECILNPATTSSESKVGLLRRSLLGLGGPAACVADPCSPHCMTFVDTPGDIGVDPDAGLRETDAGISLAGDPGPVGPPIGGGFGCRGGSYPATTGACAHHICEVGSVLSGSCDETQPATTHPTLFSDSFTNGNALGWTLDSTWAIGSATSSSGHTTGNADPSTDATPGSDNNVAGTVLGGNIGGATVLFSDTFSNLNAWTETGEGDWNTEALSSSAGYPATGSGSNAAHSDTCTTSCTITLTSAVNLSGYASASLDLLRFLDENLDTGEYLKLEAYNGTSWATLFNWTSEVYDDDTWHAEHFDLAASYRVSGFKIRFVTMESSSNEHVHVDDVQISVPPASATRWLTSPTFNATTVNGAVSLEFKRWLNIESPASRAAKVEVYDGTSWVNLWTNTAAVSDNAWSTQTFDLTPYKSAAMKLRFGWTGAAASKVSGWNLDDVVVTGTHTPPPIPGCVDAVCNQDPTCCSTSWHAGCLALILSKCQITCSRDRATSACVACYNSTTETTDYDGDGYSRAQGDCLECDATINPGAFDFPGNSLDENCDGTADNEATNCDGALAPGGDAWAHARAIGLCKVAGGGSWGVTGASFVKADGTTACTDSKQYYIASDYGSGNLPTNGTQMAVYSSGTARDKTDPGWVLPNGNGYDANTTSSPKYSVPPAAGCHAGTAGLDSCGLKLTIRAPTNARSFSFNFDFFTAEYPEWLCTSYNDAFVAYYDGSLNTQADRNVSFDSLGNPVSVNNGFFTIPGWPPPATGTNPLLDGTGHDGVCNNNLTGSTYKPNSICGGSTGWLVTSAPVASGETITLQFSIWDTGDHKWDSAVLLDNFAWSATEASITTARYEPGNSISTTLEPSSFIRDYDATTVCTADQVPVWSLWSWTSSVPSDSRIEFFVSAASTVAELDGAPEDRLMFSDPPGPSARAGQNAMAQSASPSTQNGSVLVDEALRANGRDPSPNAVRIRSYLVPSTDGMSAPVLNDWNLEFTCVDNV